MPEKSENPTTKARRRERSKALVRASPWPLTRPVLQFAPLAWIKMQFLCHLGDTEVGGFGVVSDPSELIVSDVILVRQRCSLVSVVFDDESVAVYFDAMVDRGLAPQQFARVWLHTHPGGCAQPSGVDEETFQRAFGRCDWSVMFILASGGETYARLRFGAGPGGKLDVPSQVRWDLPLGEINDASWHAEYKANVTEEVLPKAAAIAVRGQRFDTDVAAEDPDDAAGALEEICTAWRGLECEHDCLRF